MFSMYHNSTHREHWTFASKDELAKLRETTNQKYRSRMMTQLKIPPGQYLTTEEEQKFLSYYEGQGSKSLV